MKRTHAAFALILTLAIAAAFLWPKELQHSSLSSTNSSIDAAPSPSSSTSLDRAKDISSAQKTVQEPAIDNPASEAAFRELSEHELHQLKLTNYEQYLRYQAQKESYNKGQISRPVPQNELQRQALIEEVLKDRLLHELENQQENTTPPK